MVKSGDRIKCIKNNSGEHPLKLNNIYTVNDFESTIWDEVYISLCDQPGKTFLLSRFVYIKEQRKQKLKEICSK